MMEAAQLAAEAAMREAMARDAAQKSGGGGGGGGSNNDDNLVNMINMMNNSTSSFMADSSDQMMGQMGLISALQSDADLDGGQQQQQAHHEQQHAQHEQPVEGRDNNNEMLFHEMSMMGVDPNDRDSVQAFLGLLQQRAEQEQHEQEQEQRPEEHYMTIAQNGMYRRNSL